MRNFAALRHGMFAPCFVLALATGCSLALSVARTQAQPLPAASVGIDALRSSIRSASDGHAGAEEMGALYLQLGNRYQDQLEFAQAEDAFAHAQRVLRDSTARGPYAGSLDAMGSLYLEMGRFREAETQLQQALQVYVEVDDGPRVEKVHETMAIVLLQERRYREAEQRSLEAIRGLASEAKLNVSELVAAYLTHNYALCSEGDCRSALDDANRAMEMAREKLRPDSIELVAAQMARGFDEWKTGSDDAADQDMSEALAALRRRTDIPHPLFVKEQLGAMQQYKAFLKASHRKPQAKEMEQKIARLKDELPAACNGCTVSVAALAPGAPTP
jgi:tetratricopeptide (TPR) repeat protein